MATISTYASPRTQSRVEQYLTKISNRESVMQILETIDVRLVGLQYQDKKPADVPRDRPLRLVREPANKVDRNAILVLFPEKKNEILGYIKQEAARFLAPIMDDKSACRVAIDVMCPSSMTRRGGDYQVWIQLNLKGLPQCSADLRAFLQRFTEGIKTCFGGKVWGDEAPPPALPAPAKSSPPQNVTQPSQGRSPPRRRRHSNAQAQSTTYEADFVERRNSAQRVAEKMFRSLDTLNRWLVALNMEAQPSKTKALSALQQVHINVYDLIWGNYDQVFQTRSQLSSYSHQNHLLYPRWRMHSFALKKFVRHLAFGPLPAPQ